MPENSTNVGAAERIIHGNYWALAAALEKAGLKKEQVDFIKKIEPDFEHGRQIFEIEFYKDGFEYEFDIDATSGKVLKYKKDWD